MNTPSAPSPDAVRLARVYRLFVEIRENAAKRMVENYPVARTINVPPTQEDSHNA